MSRWRARDLRVDTKPDRTPVTEADHAVEEMLRERLARARPDDSILGEELGVTGDSRRRWVIDPIDGTKSYLRGAPAWATLVALEEDDTVVVGLVSAPALGRRWWATAGHGAFADGDPVQVSAVHELSDAVLSFTDVAAFAHYGMGDEFADLAARTWDRRGWGDFWGHVLVAEGVADVMVEPVVSHWDVAAVRVVVQEAGGRCTDRAGGTGPDGGDAVSSNGLLHDAVLSIVGRA